MTIIARLAKDERLAGAAEYLLSAPRDAATISKYADVIREYVEQWDNTETTDPNNVMRKFEELVWTNVAIYGTTGFRPDGEFNNNFFL